MKRGGFQRGSALLIVLGMMTVIVVSAVAFSAYMRYSRVPSSYLRRTSSSRLLVKAALAEAIERIDCAIGNNPHPGIMNKPYSYPRVGGVQLYNNWQDRIFIGGTNQTQTASVDDTVSVLNVEALAYLPPPLINEARFWSRRSLAAVWEPMGFDAGRYAFCAVDVSDYIDINRVRCANSDWNDQPIYGRTSADNGRISLSYAFENSNHTGYQSIDPTQWDNFMENYLGEGRVPLVSLADYNMAINSRGWTDSMSPFCNFFKNNVLFVNSRNGDAAEFLRHQAFVTDSLFQVTNAANNMVDLACEEDQPFYDYEGYRPDDDEKQNDVRLDALVAGKASQNFWNNSGIQRTDLQNAGEYIMLYDYLDKDSVPSSLALPTVERTPMVCGISLEGSTMTIGVTKEDKQQTTVDPNVKWKWREYTLHVSCPQLEAEVGTVYPFKYDHGRNLSWQVQAAATIAFVPGDCDQLRRNGANSAFVVARNDWQNSQQQATTKSYGRNNLGKAIMMRSNMVNVPIKKATSGEADEKDVIANDIALSFGRVDVDLTGDIAAQDELPACKCTYRVAQKFRVVNNNGTITETPDGNPVIQYGWLPANAALTDADNLQDGTAASAAYKPVIQLWVRIVDNNNETVDLVPAFVEDDKNALTERQDATDAKISYIRPLVRFYDKGQTKGTVTFTAGNYDQISMDADSSQDVEIYPQAYLADDPRFNYAPENLVAMDSFSSSSLGEEWLQKQTSSSHDGDIFMATSDAGYMQSKYELANILRINKISGGLSGVGDDGVMRTSFGNSPVKDVMWNTYSLGWNGTDDLQDLTIYNGTRGYRINPYTPSTEVMMFALANTPIDWWAASTNDANDTAKAKMMGDQNEANKYAFSQMPGATIRMEHGKINQQDGKAPEDTLLKLAETMRDQFRASSNWEDVYRTLGWTTADEIAGVDLGVNLHAVDRKYLYGFWKECLAARQQLFLVFVRAEPMMMGGGTLGQSPPQLGARAVALVWRDPAATIEDVSGRGNNQNGNYMSSSSNSSNQPRPHRSRILFYRQFD